MTKWTLREAIDEAVTEVLSAELGPEARFGEDGSISVPATGPEISIDVDRIVDAIMAAIRDCAA
jgi:hypothetical protein